MAPSIGICVAVAQLVVAFTAPAVVVEIAYMFVLVWHLVVAGMGFVNLLFATRAGPDE